MTEREKAPAEKETQQVVGLLAQFSSAASLVAAARACRERGHRQLEAFSPFPIHGIDGVLRTRPTRLPWFVLLAGIAGGIGALLLQWWTNAVDYPFLISGKPRFSLPANVPVIFEVIILFAALTAFFGMLGANRLPRLANRLLRNKRFLRVTNDRFFLLVSDGDAKTTLEDTRSYLSRLGATNIELLRASKDDMRIPRGWAMALSVLLCLALIPPAWVARARYAPSSKPRVHNFFDMDQQPRFDAQTASSLFADGRSSRPPVAGTIARGDWNRDVAIREGITPESNHAEATLPVAAPTASPADEEVPEPNWVREFPVPVTDDLMRRGQERFNVYCAVCHGLTGDGNGLASLRALELQQGTWVPPTSLYAEHVMQQPPGQLFHTITHGIRKMPAYGAQIPPEDRWAIVLYLRALQRTQNATLQDVPEDLRNTLREMN